MNKIILIGRITKDMEIRYVGEKNTAMASFSLAVDRKFKQNGQPDADFLSCQVWGKTAEVLVKYCAKGSKIAVTGRLQNRSYDKDGEKKYITEVVVDEVEFLDSKKSNDGGGQAPSQTDGFYPSEDNDELPF